MRERVAVAMSGGVDSSVAAAILAERGYDVVGIAMRLSAHEQGVSAGGRAACCSYEDFEDARRVAERMNFPFYVIDMRRAFKTRVIDNFVDEYLAGRTPNPCMMCNGEIKFDAFRKIVCDLGAELVATGHYARIASDDLGRYHLMRARDEDKDQSYFLFMLDQQMLSRTLFPLGDLTKAAVRQKARELGLLNADKPESQEICFVPDRDYARFVERNSPSERITGGELVDSKRRVLGNHDGIHKFTVGQRRGLGLATGEPLYVRHIDAATGRVTVGRRWELGARGLRARQVRMIDPESANPRSKIEIKIRYRHPAVPATLRLMEPDQAEVLFDSDCPAVTPGQACVFYQHDEVIGGGIIEQPVEG